MSMIDAKEIYKPKKGSDLYLLPCPFCGCEEVVYMKYDHATGERWAAVCMDCMAEIDPGWAQEKYAVRDMWNRRQK